MKIATVLFTYKRKDHTEKVLDALRRNTELPEKLFIFQDGLRDFEDKEAWKKTNELIKTVSWSNCETIISKENKGLAKSIVSGLEFVFRNYDAVIVLEDDCVPQKLFMTYMNNALNYYNNTEKVYCINAYSHPIEVKENGTDVYFTHRTCSSGWATWKDKWSIYEEDYKLWGRMLKNNKLSEQLHIWGEDLESYLLGNMYGRCDSWAVFWALNVIAHGGYCVYPYSSLIDNIGFDGSGEHSGTGGQGDIVLMSCDKDKEFVFCDNLSIDAQTEKKFSDFFAWKSAESKNGLYYDILVRWMNLHMIGRTVNEFLNHKGIERICIWGRGKICDLLLKEFDEKRTVLAIIESRPFEKEYRGIDIINSKDIPEETDAIIVIPEYDYQKIICQVDEKYHSRFYKISDVLQ